MPPIVFSHDDGAYLAWRRKHLHDGFVVNVDDTKPGGTRLHKTDCSFLQVPIDAGWSLTGSYRKVCSTDLPELGPIWQRNGGRKCSRCTP